MDASVQTIVDSIFSEKKISGQWPLSQLFTILDALTEVDRKIEKKNSKMKKITGIAFLLTITLMVGTIVAANSSSYAELAFPFFILAMVSFVSGIVGVVLIIKIQKKDVPNEYRTYLRPLLKNLQEDIKPNSPVEVNLHLSPIDQKQFSKGRSEEYQTGIYHSCFDDFYERELLNLKLRLNDGNRIILTTHELLVRSVRTKRTARKLKTKYKYKKRMTFDNKVIVDPEKFYCKKLPTEGDLRFYAKQRNSTPIIGVRFKETLKGWFMADMTLDPSKTLENLMVLYAYVHPKTSASAQE